jgi:glycosyltransferase involved in cell wall biosynthesis
MEQKPRICIIIPAYNEGDTVVSVIRDVRQQQTGAAIVVVNDASNDQTARKARLEGVDVLDLPINLGIGGAMTAGFRYAVRNGYDVAVQLDGDGQHDPAFLERVLEPVLKGRADMAIGSRFLGGRGYTSTTTRLLGIRFFGYLIGLATNKRFSDPTSGYRAYNRAALEFVAKYYPQDFPEPESIVLMLKNGFKIKEVSVEMRERLGGISSIRPLKAGYFVVSNALAIGISVLKSYKR